MVLLKAVVDPTRMRILSALSSTELCVCDLEMVVGISKSNACHQVRLLRTVKLIRYRCPAHWSMPGSNPGLVFAFILQLVCVDFRHKYV